MEVLNSEYRRQVAMKEAAFERRVKRVLDLERQLETVIQKARETEKELQRQKTVINRQQAQLAQDKNKVASEVERVTEQLVKKHKFEMEAERRRHADIVAELRRQQRDDRKRITELQEELTQLKVFKGSD